MARRSDVTKSSFPLLHLVTGAGFPDTRASTISLVPALAVTTSETMIFGPTKKKVLMYKMYSDCVIHEKHSMNKNKLIMGEHKIFVYILSCSLTSNMPSASLAKLHPIAFLAATLNLYLVFSFSPATTMVKSFTTEYDVHLSSG